MTNAPQTALVPATRDSRAIEPQNFGEMWRMAEAMYASRMFPAAQNPEQALAIMLKGRELGLPVMQALTEIFVIKGKIQLSASLMAGLILRSGAAEYFACVESTPERATYTTKRRGDPTGEKRLTYTFKDAQAAGLVKDDGGYRKHPAALLRARATTNLGRMVYPDVLAGCYTPDEIAEIVPEQISVRVDSPPLAPVAAPVVSEPAPLATSAARSEAALARAIAKIAAATTVPEVDEIERACSKFKRLAEVATACQKRREEIAAAALAAEEAEAAAEDEDEGDEAAPSATAPIRDQHPRYDHD